MKQRSFLLIYICPEWHHFHYKAYEKTKNQTHILSSGLTLKNGLTVFVLLVQMKCPFLAKAHTIKIYRGSLVCQLVLSH